MERFLKGEKEKCTIPTYICADLGSIANSILHFKIISKVLKYLKYYKHNTIELRNDHACNIFIAIYLELQ